MKHIVLFVIVILVIQTLYSQVMVDTIITNKLDTIPCRVTYVNNYSIFYKYIKGKKGRVKEKILPRIDVVNLIINNKDVNIPEKKCDSGINEYYRKSKLNRKYEVLLLNRNSSNLLKLLADSTFTRINIDLFYIATKIQSFARLYRCKLIYVSKVNTQELNVKLYDAPDNYYQKISNSYKKNQIYFLRTSNKIEPKERVFKLNDKKITLLKNEYYTLDLTKIDSTFILKQKGFRDNKKYKKGTIFNNEYYYIGNPNYYSDFRARDFGIVGGFVLGGLIGGGIVVAVTNNRQVRLSNFVGEFIIMNIDKINNNGSATINSKNTQ